MKSEDEEIELSDGSKINLYTFARQALGYSLLTPDPHKEWANEISKRRKRSLWLEPRHTYKSTLFTKAYVAWRLFVNPNLRILIVNATAGNAEAFLREIVGHHIHNQRVIDLYFDRHGIPPLNPNAAKKSSVTFDTRTKIMAEPSISTVGALGNLVSAHYDLIIVDDLANIDDRESPAIREKKKRWFQDLVSVISPEGEIVVVGTRWHYDDIYAFLINEINPGLSEDSKYFIHIDACYLEDGETPRFPSILNAQKLKDLKVEKGILIFACNYLNNPLPEEHQIFKDFPLHTYRREEVDFSRAKTYGFVDPARGGADFNAIITVAVQDNVWYVYDCYMERMGHSRLVNKLIELHKRYNYQEIALESNDLGMTKDNKELSTFETVLKDKQAEAGIHIPYSFIWHSIPKPVRIQSIEPYYTNGTLKFLEDWNRVYPRLGEQLMGFPVASHDDAPDALEGVISLILKSQDLGGVVVPVNVGVGPSKWRS